MTLTETFSTRYEALDHAIAQQRAYRGSRVLVSGAPGSFTVSTTNVGPEPVTYGFLFGTTIDEGLYGFGQLGALLRSRFCDPKICGINKTDGLTFKVKEILERVKTNVTDGLRKQ